MAEAMIRWRSCPHLTSRRYCDWPLGHVRSSWRLCSHTGLSDFLRLGFIGGFVQGSRVWRSVMDLVVVCIS